MTRFALVAAACLYTAAPSPSRAQRQPPVQKPASPPPIRSVVITRVLELPEHEPHELRNIRVGDPMPEDLNVVTRRFESRYNQDGYTFATVKASAARDSGALTITVDEGVIEEVRFEGVDPRLARTFAEDFALRAGDVFNRARAREALDVLLRRTRGAVRPGAVYQSGRGDRDRLTGRRGTFDLVDLNGRRTLLVGLSEPSGRFRLAPDMGDREDWFTPVDGLVPSLGFGAAVFDHTDFNHAYVAGHVSYKTAAD